MDIPVKESGGSSTYTSARIGSATCIYTHASGRIADSYDTKTEKSIVADSPQPGADKSALTLPRCADT